MDNIQESVLGKQEVRINQEVKHMSERPVLGWSLLYAALTHLGYRCGDIRPPKDPGWDC